MSACAGGRIMDAPRANPWYTTNRFLAISLGGLLLLLAVEAVIGITRRDNDFAVHRAFGQAFLAGEPYGIGQRQYLPARGMLNAFTGASLPYPAHRALHFAAAVVLLVLSFAMWQRMANDSAAPGKETSDWRLGYAAAVFSLLTVGP